MGPKKKRLGPPPPAPAKTRSLTSGPERVASYPTAMDVVSRPDLAALVRRALRVAAASGLVLLGAAGSGCADPVCAASSTDELVTHGKSAVRDVGSLEVKAAVEELGIGLGIMPHPAGMMIAGEMPAVMPTPMPPPAPTSGGGTPLGSAERPSW